MNEAAEDYEKTVYFYQTTRRHVAENRSFCSHRQEQWNTLMIGATVSSKTLELHTNVNGDRSRRRVFLSEVSAI
jgi:hypothetical protein